MRCECLNHGDRQGGVLVDDRHRPGLSITLLIFAKHTGAIVRELANIQAIFAGIHYLRANMMVFHAILFDLVIVLFG